MTVSKRGVISTTLSQGNHLVVCAENESSLKISIFHTCNMYFTS